jgi:hypothetical protein
MGFHWGSKSASQNIAWQPAPCQGGEAAREGMAKAKAEGKYRGLVATAQRKAAEVVQLRPAATSRNARKARLRKSDCETE